MFCAAIPTVATAGVVTSSRQRQAAKVAVAQGKPAPHPRVPTGPVTASLVVLLVIGSVLYHTHYPV